MTAGVAWWPFVLWGDPYQNAVSSDGFHRFLLYRRNSRPIPGVLVNWYSQNQGAIQK